MTKLERNAPCPCGSKVKYKHCCRLTQDPLEPAEQLRPGTRIRCVTDWYSVDDRRALASLFEGLPEVVGCPERGWSRIDPERQFFEPIAALVFDQDGQMEVTTATEFAAETTRWWLERVAGEFVTHLNGAVSGEEIGSEGDSTPPTIEAREGPPALHLPLEFSS